AGIILGRAEVVERLYAHPLMRALRPDKLTLAALAATLQLYATGQREQLPIWQMLRPCAEDLAQRARAVQQQVGASPLAIALSPGQSATGGGSLPGETLPTTLLVVTHPQRSAEDLASALRSQQPPVVGRIERDQLLLDLRTVLPDQDALVIKALQALG
ncbi:MAG: L-seryl-tRNA(Sec) selenium transferase, partial [Deinococcus sp.]|nr:L-seryl-tRNA(Sec) selenium transferase [Deinococcus sp.]